MPVKHEFHCDVPDIGGTKTIKPSHWNRNLVGTGGADGLPLLRKAAHADGMDFAATAAEARAGLDVYSQDEVDALIADSASAGSGGALGQWDWSTATTSPATSSQVRADVAHPWTTITKLWVRNITGGGTDARTALLLLVPDQTLYLQDKNDSALYLKVRVTAAPIGQSGQVEVPCAWVANGSALLNNQAIAVWVGGGPPTGAPVGAPYVTTAADATLTNETVLAAGTGLSLAGATFSVNGPATTAQLDLFTSTTKGVAPASGGGTANFLRADGAWAAPPAGTLANDSVTDAQLRNSAALSVIGRSANSTGDPADIAAAADGQVLRRAGTTLGFGTIATAGYADGSISNAKFRDCFGTSVIGRAASSVGAPADITAGTDGQVLRRAAGALAFGAVELADPDAVTGTLPSVNGGMVAVPVSLANGGTAGTDAATARTNLDVFSKSEVQGTAALTGMTFGDAVWIMWNGIQGVTAHGPSGAGSYVGFGNNAEKTYINSTVSTDIAHALNVYGAAALYGQSEFCFTSGIARFYRDVQMDANLAVTGTGGVKAGGYVTGTTGALAAGAFGISSVSRSSAGVYVVTWSAARASATYGVQATAVNSAAFRISVTLTTAAATVRTFNASNAATDTDFTVMAV